MGNETPWTSCNFCRAGGSVRDESGSGACRGADDKRALHHGSGHAARSARRACPVRGDHEVRRSLFASGGAGRALLPPAPQVVPSSDAVKGEKISAIFGNCIHAIIFAVQRPCRHPSAKRKKSVEWRVENEMPEMRE